MTNIKLWKKQVNLKIKVPSSDLQDVDEGKTSLKATIIRIYAAYSLDFYTKRHQLHPHINQCLRQKDEYPPPLQIYRFPTQQKADIK